MFLYSNHAYASDKALFPADQVRSTSAASAAAVTLDVGARYPRPLLRQVLPSTAFCDFCRLSRPQKTHSTSRRIFVDQQLKCLRIHAPLSLVDQACKPPNLVGTGPNRDLFHPLLFRDSPLFICVRYPAISGPCGCHLILGSPGTQGHGAAFSASRQTATTGPWLVFGTRHHHKQPPSSATQCMLVAPNAVSVNPPWMRSPRPLTMLRHHVPISSQSVSARHRFLSPNHLGHVRHCYAAVGCLASPHDRCTAIFVNFNTFC